MHVIGPELGLTQPGMTIVCGDSHTVDARRVRRARVRHRHERGRARARDAVPAAAHAEDARGARRRQAAARASPRRTSILAIIAKIGVGGGTGARHRVHRRRDPRARHGRAHDRLQHVDRGRRARRHDRARRRRRSSTSRAARTRRRAPRGTRRSRAGAQLPTRRGRDATTATVALDADALEPMITYGTNPGMGIADHDGVRCPTPAIAARAPKALRYMGLEPGKPLLGQPGRRRLHRLAAPTRASPTCAPAARVLDGPQGRRRRARAGRARLAGRSSSRPRPKGLDRDLPRRRRRVARARLLDVHRDERRPARSPASTRSARSNRNFEGRQGNGGRTFLASPLTAAATAVTGTRHRSRGTLADGQRSTLIRSHRAPSRCPSTTSTPTRSSRRAS